MAIAAKAMSTSGDEFSIAISVGLSFGLVVGVVTVLGVPPLAVPPAVAAASRRRDPGDRRKVDYAEVERRFSDYVVTGGGRATRGSEPSLRNHTLDAVGVGVFDHAAAENVTGIGGA